MKKMLTLALAVLGFTAAQALTWTSIGTNVKNGDSYTINNNNGSFSVALVVDLAAVPTQEIANSFFSVLSSGLTTGIGVGKTTLAGGVHYYPWQSAMNNGTTPGFFINGKMDSAAYQEGKNIIGITIDASGTAPKAFFYVNGVYDTDGQASYSTATAKDFNTINIGTFAAGGDLYISYDGIATADDYAAVPEPTALALLALGVAGVALKRKKVVA